MIRKHDVNLAFLQRDGIPLILDTDDEPATESGGLLHGMTLTRGI
jgi:hypothetical protein